MKETVAGKTTWFLYDGLSVIAEFSDDKEPDSVIVPGICRTRLDLHEPLTEYYLLDGLGSVAQLTDELGNITQEYFYDVFGAARNVKRDPFNRYRFVGLAHDDLTGLIYMNARWYEPGTGRFVSRDPIPGDRLNTQASSRYVYVANNPVNVVDKTGLSWKDVVDWLKEKAKRGWDWLLGRDPSESGEGRTDEVTVEDEVGETGSLLSEDLVRVMRQYEADIERCRELASGPGTARQLSRLAKIAGRIPYLNRFLKVYSEPTAKMGEAVNKAGHDQCVENAKTRARAFGYDPDTGQPL